MNTTGQLIEFIRDTFPQNRKLNYPETVKVIKAVMEISEDRELLAKILRLTNTIYNLEKSEDQVLSKRELQVFHLVGEGFKSSEIAQILNISKDTVATHRKNIIKKLKIKGSGKLQNIAFQFVKKHNKNL